MTPLFTVAAALFGLIMGSFLNMLIPRLHTGQGGILFGRSRCPHCKHNLQAQDLIPLLSFLWLKGKCRHCRVRIEFWYPLTEITLAVLFAVLYLQVQDLRLWLWLAPHFFVLTYIFFHDVRYKEIHDSVMIPGIIFAALAAFSIGNPVGAFIGAAVAGAFFALQYFISRGRWIGSGDIRIGLFIGFFLGWPMTLIALLLSYLAGSLISIVLLLRGKAALKTAVPLGPFLVLGTLLSFFWGDPILNFYYHLLYL